MRAFIALEIPSLLCSLVARSIAEVRPRLPVAQWVAAENYHLTLQFLGEIDEALIAELEDRIGAVFESHEPFSLRLGTGGTFPTGVPARIAWIGIDDQGRLEELARDVRAACADLDIHREKRPFSAHLTVARCRRPWPRSAAAEGTAALGRPIGSPFAVTRGVLMSSRLQQGGARYDVIADYPLGATS
jgi:2'-5' RNA ligase